ncbi:A/G-specific adenine glycosylase [Xylanimonas allomyrinae]|uniref:A/G-specific adenine glycosylase n=1 Tax=Xylanimonas allomyrinae TaxID=2509459 RepID=UPI001FE2714A|nr:A/G-specific adenine glycosylase [Xylanimonas allomyrinae]
MIGRTVAWFAAARRDLPWRAPSRTPWGVLVSEVMLQQTPVARVEPVWRAWLGRWPTPAALAAAPTADVLRAWDRLGYPRRALRLHECARVVVERHGGTVPADEAALRALPGVGEYTAAAVAAFAFGRRALVVDTNVRRVLARAVGGVALPAPTPTAAERQTATALVPDDDATAVAWAAASMELGALVCTARSPRCGECPVGDLCAWRAAGHPGDEHAHRRRAQAWHGTDRQCRGRIMAVLRGAPGPVPRSVIDAAIDAAIGAAISTAVGAGTRSAGAAPESRPDRAQVTRCLAGLIEDGLVEQTPARAYRLPAD